jgi:hypothetical protein
MDTDKPSAGALVEPLGLDDRRDSFARIALQEPRLKIFGHVESWQDAISSDAWRPLGAVVAVRVDDYYPRNRWWIRLHEKGGKRHDLPAHGKLEEFIDAYIAAVRVP